jgi:hypothetical protein
MGLVLSYRYLYNYSEPFKIVQVSVVINRGGRQVCVYLYRGGESASS